MNAKLGRISIVACFALGTALASAQHITVSVDNRVVNFEGTTPRMINGRVLVPLRGVFEQMGAAVEWNPSNRSVTAIKGDTDVRLQIGSRTAYVDNMAHTLDVPAQLVGGRTMVPLRFISEALGADVQWLDARNEVVIISNGQGIARTGTDRVVQRDTLRTGNYFVLNAGTVIPVKLNEKLTSNDNRRGDRFTATLDADNRNDYAGLPIGTRVEGRIVTARAKSGNDPGLLELEFTRLIMPDGRSVAIDGSLTSLTSEHVTRNSDGVIVAKQGKQEDRLVYAGIGAGAGLIVGLLTNRELEGTLIGGLLGYLYGENKARQGGQARDVTLNAGTEFGVRLDRDVTVYDR